MTLKAVRYTGKFRDLKADGWSFIKLYARNYKCYYKRIGKSEYGPCLRIWQHYGGYLEIENLDILQTYVFVDQLLKGDKLASIYTSIGNKNQKVYWLVWDTKLKRFYPCHSKIYLSIHHYLFFPVSEKSAKKFTKENLIRYRDRFRTIHINTDVIDILKPYLDNNTFILGEINYKR